MTLPARTHTPDLITIKPDGTKSTRFHLKRACNGCGVSLGDVDNRDVDEHGDLTDVRGECPTCAPLVELEKAGCKTWQLTLRNIEHIDGQVDRDGHYAKGYYAWDEAEGKTALVGLRIGTGEDRIVARFGDHLVRHPDGTWTVQPAPASTTSA